jgi:alpha-D-xyloside xylohydrolase
MPDLLNHPFDISPDFRQLANEYFLPGQVTEFDAFHAKGKIQWNFHRYTLDWFFNKIDKHLQQSNDKGAPFQDYDVHPRCEFSFSFISSRTIRLRMKTTTAQQQDHPSLMLDGELANSNEWNMSDDAAQTSYQSPHGRIVINKKSFQLQVYNANGRLVTGTQSIEELQAMHSKAMPFSFVRRVADYSRSMSASFSLSPGERIYGGGESFTSLNKRSQKMVLWTVDAQSTASQQMYKPVPFFLSSRGYGLFAHTSSPVTFDFGYTHDGSQTIYIGEDQLDLFIFLGSPVEILAEYTSLTGKSPLPPLWSFGLWMSRFSYRSQGEVKTVAQKLREHQVPCDVIHIDAGWFKKGINCDFEFCRDQFPDPPSMMNDLKDIGFRTSLWQIPYFTPHNPIFDEVVAKKLYVKDGNGNVPTEDAILDFSNEETRKWYRGKLTNLFKQGASVIKADFGEAAPRNGLYASGRTGFYEHNLYPLRYNKLVAEITREASGDHIIWARSAWAGSQRYPLHWGGDAEVSDAGMAGTLKAGLSFGLSGFSFWSHDIGGFSGSPKEELFLRWAFFGLMSSHSRVHGFPPREPWEFSENFQTVFRKIVEMRYRLIPYVYTQAALASSLGLPLVKALFLNYPADPTTWMIEDQYLFGNDILVAPLMDGQLDARNVYLPQGKWVDYHSGKSFEGERWHLIKPEVLPGILLVRWGSLIPQVPLAQSTEYIDWTKLELLAYAEDEARGHLFLDNQMISLEAKNSKGWKDHQNRFPVKSFKE